MPMREFLPSASSLKKGTAMSRKGFSWLRESVRLTCGEEVFGKSGSTKAGGGLFASSAHILDL